MRRFLAALAATAVACTGWAVPGYADLQQPAVVNPNPVDWTPNVLDGEVTSIAVVGDTVVVGGDFRRIGEAGARDSIDRPYLFAFNRVDGRLRDFRPDLDGAVNALVAGPDDTVYVGGAFRRVNGSNRRGIVRLNLFNGEISDGFDASVDNGDVRALEAYGGAVYVGGSFTGVNGFGQVALARIDGRTGAVDRDFQVGITGPGLTRTKIEDMALSADGSRLVIIGEILAVGGYRRAQLAVLNVGAGQPRLSSWYTDAYDNMCHKSYKTYVRAVDFAPDSSYFVVVTTGAHPGPQRMCDSAARFDLAGDGLHRPTWVNHTGGDSLTAVSVTGAAVYVGGHQRWMNNPYGNNSPGQGAVDRPGLAALDPGSGSALPWNPTRSRGKGVRAMVATSAGLFIGSDTDRLGNEYHGRLGLFPLG